MAWIISFMLGQVFPDEFYWHLYILPELSLSHSMKCDFYNVS